MGGVRRRGGQRHRLTRLPR
ncbi:hypothetical protein STRTUCAR8_05188, partial [Streptomyces turgidiscabies Car8]